MRNGNPALGFVGGLLGALLGALAFAAIVVITEYSIGLLALLIGAAAGGGVKLLGRGGGLPLQIVAVLTTIIGIVAAKFFTISGVMVSVAKKNGVEMGYFDDRIIESFWPAVKATSEMPGLIYEIAWAAGAVFIAWSMVAASDND